MSSPKQSGMLFNAEMVRAILDGRKTQTRRPMKAGPEPPRSVYGLPQSDTVITPRLASAMTQSGSLSTFVGWEWSMTKLGNVDAKFRDSTKLTGASPFGGVGDLIWGRETWRPIWNECGCTETPCDCFDLYVRYAADGCVSPSFNDADVGEWNWPKAADRGNVSPLLMPMWASRLWLENTNVRVEQVNAITERDAIAEGFYEKFGDMRQAGFTRLEEHLPNGKVRVTKLDPREQFKDFWIAAYGQESWDKGWCWVYDFKRVKRPTL